jgi:hypothetical protein
MQQTNTFTPSSEKEAFGIQSVLIYPSNLILIFNRILKIRFLDKNFVYNINFLIRPDELVKIRKREFWCLTVTHSERETVMSMKGSYDG